MRQAGPWRVRLPSDATPGHAPPRSSSARGIGDYGPACQSGGEPGNTAEPRP